MSNLWGSSVPIHRWSTQRF